MGLLDGIVESPQWKAFQGQLIALLGMVQDTNARVRRMEIEQREFQQGLKAGLEAAMKIKEANDP